MKKHLECPTCNKFFRNGKNLRWHMDMNHAVGCYGEDHIRETGKRQTMAAIRNALKSGR